MNIFRAFLLFLVLAPALRAEQLVLSLVPSSQIPAAGDVAIDLVILNRGTEAQVITAPAALAAEIALGARSWRVELRAAPGAPLEAISVAPGEFSTRTYTFTAPADAAGTAIVKADLAGFAAVRGVIDTASRPLVAQSVSADGKSADQVGKPTTNLTRAEPAASIIQRTFANRLAPHEPIYFLYGPDAPAAKLQFSFKYKLLQFTDVTSGRRARTLQFAFTQRSLWDIDGESSPFYDTSYMPELIYESLSPKPEELDTWFTWLGYSAAFKHESNGRAGLVSRSLNIAYLRTVFAFGALDGWHLLVIPEFSTYVDSLDDNPDLKDYRGYGLLRLVLGRNDGPSLMATAWAGDDFEHHTVQLDLTIPVRTRLLDFETYFLVQYFNGYGESLLSYWERSETIRAGFSLVR